MDSDNSPLQAAGDDKLQQQIQANDKLEVLALSFLNPLALKAAVDLGIPDILSRGGGVLTLKMIAEQLPTNTVQMEWLYRVMRINVLNEVFTELTILDVHLEIGERRFGLTLISSLLVHDNNPLCPVPLYGMLWERTGYELLFRLSEAILSGTEPCQLEYGKSYREWVKERPVEVLINAMACDSRRNLPALLKGYKGFKGLKQLVDVGGSTGTTLALITQAYPEIEGINYDLPRVVAAAPAIPGVKHVGGDMFVSIPQGDAIILKLILHNWGDHDSITILQNCHKSLPEDGKVIVFESVLPDLQDAIRQPELRKHYFSDMVMLSRMGAGRERTALEWHRLFNDAGFKRVEINSYPPCRLKTIEGFKH